MNPPIIATIENGRVFLSLATLLGEEEEPLAQAIREVLAQPRPAVPQGPNRGSPEE